MLNLPNAYGTIDPAELLRALTDQVPPPVRDQLEAWHDAHDGRDSSIDEAREHGYETAAEEHRPYKDAWQELFDVWQDAAADGRWPCPEPGDSTLARAMADDIRGGAAALAAVRDVLSDLDKPSQQRRPLREVREVLRAALED